jgi:hypothetical protein
MECAICLETVNPVTSVKLNCTHSFHNKCFRKVCETSLEILCPYCREPYDCYLENTLLDSSAPENISNYTKINKKDKLSGFMYICKRRFPVYKLYTNDSKNYIFVTHYLRYLILSNKFEPRKLHKLKSATCNIIIYNSKQKLNGKFSYEDSMFYMEGAFRLIKLLRPHDTIPISAYNDIVDLLHINITKSRAEWVTSMFSAVYSLGSKYQDLILDNYSFDKLNKLINYKLKRRLFYSFSEKNLNYLYG